MIKERLKKILICILISTLLFTNFFTILPDIIEIFSTYATTVDLENQNTVTQNSNVRFDAFFTTDGGQSGTHSVIQNVDSDAILALQMQSISGTLSNISISFKDLNNTTDVNYNLLEELASQEYITSVDMENKIVNLNTTIQNSTATMTMPLRIQSTEQYKLEYLNKTTKVILNAIYTDTAGNQTPISHEIQINLGWEGTYEMQIGQRIEKYVPYEKDGKKGVLVEVAVVSKLNTEGKYTVLPIKQTTLQTTAPQFAGIKPTSVSVGATRTEATNGEDELNITFNTSNWSYNATTGAINITVQNPEENGYIWAGKGSDEFIITYDYPEAAYNLVDAIQGIPFISDINVQIQ